MNQRHGVDRERRVAPGAREERGRRRCRSEKRKSASEPEPVDGRRDRDERAAHRRAVEDASGGRIAEIDADRDRRRASRRRTRRRVSESVAGSRVKISRPHRDAVLVRVAEVEVEDEALQEAPVLDVDGPVEPERVPDLRDQLGRRLPAGPERRRVGRRERVEDHERQRADDDEHERAPERRGARRSAASTRTSDRERAGQPTPALPSPGAGTPGDGGVGGECRRRAHATTR